MNILGVREMAHESETIEVEVSVPVAWFEELERHFQIKMTDLPEQLIAEFFSYSVGFGVRARKEFENYLNEYQIPYKTNDIY